MSDVNPQKANGLKTALDTIIAPKEAFEAIRSMPTWFAAFIISIAVAMICSYLAMPANEHALAAGWSDVVAKSPMLSGESPDQQQAALAMTQKIVSFGFLFMIVLAPVYFLIEALVMTIFNALGRGQGTFGKYWAAACNIGMVNFAVYSVVLAAIVLVRGADSFNSTRELQLAMPSLGLLVPASSVKLAAFFSAINVFSIWSAALSGVAVAVVGRVPKVQAWLTGIVMLVVPALLTMAFAK